MSLNAIPISKDADPPLAPRPKAVFLPRIFGAIKEVVDPPLASRPLVPLPPLLPPPAHLAKPVPHVPRPPLCSPAKHLYGPRPPLVPPPAHLYGPRKRGSVCLDPAVQDVGGRKKLRGAVCLDPAVQDAA